MPLATEGMIEKVAIVRAAIRDAFERRPDPRPPLREPVMIDGKEIKPVWEAYAGGGRSATEAEHLARAAISEVANLGDFLEEWAKSAGIDPAPVKATFKGSSDLGLLRDLSNAHKHPDKTKGWETGGRPSLHNVKFVVGVRSSVISIPFDVDAAGKAGAIVDTVLGYVHDAKGSIVARLEQLVRAGMAAWGPYLAKHDLDLTTLQRAARMSQAEVSQYFLRFRQYSEDDNADPSSMDDIPDMKALFVDGTRIWDAVETRTAFDACHAWVWIGARQTPMPVTGIHEIRIEQSNGRVLEFEGTIDTLNGTPVFKVTREGPPTAPA